MMFTGKNKEDFEKWLIKQDYIIKQFLDAKLVHEGFGFAFINLPFSMQQGVYLEYLDSVGYYVDIKQELPKIGKFEWFLWYDNVRARVREFGGGYPTRQEALKEAFKKADELINT